MGKVITVSNQKGGVGKTTTVNAVSSVLRGKGYRVLCVDFDPQGNLSFGMDADAESSPTIYNALKRELPTRDAVQQTDVGEVIPANILLSGAEVEFTGDGREFLLRDALKPLIPLYDYVFIDSPPGLGFLTVNAFAASDLLLIPILPDMYSLQGIARIHETIQYVRVSCNPNLTIAGVFLTQYYARQTLSREVRGTAEMLSQALGFPLLKSTVRNSVQLTKTQTLQLDMATNAKDNSAVQDYMALTDELLKGGM